MSNKLPGCFKYGCIGCVGLIALFFGLVFLVSAVQFASQKDPNPVERTAEQILPAPPPLPAGDATADRPETIEIGGEPTVPDAPTVAGGTLVLDLAMGEFRVVPGPADEPIRVHADFDDGSYELEEAFMEGEGGRWEYRVSFGGKSGLFGALMRNSGNVHNEVEIVVPRGHPLKIVGKIAMGESKMDLGGLWIQEVDLEYSTGDHFIEVGEPIPFPMERFAVAGSMGEVEIRNVGEASPRRLDVSHRMGELFLDLSGAWRQDAEAEVSFRMGSCRVWVPEETRVALRGGQVSMGESRQRLPDYTQLPEDAPQIDLEVSGAMGELRVEHRGED